MPKKKTATKKTATKKKVAVEKPVSEVKEAAEEVVNKEETETAVVETPEAPKPTPKKKVPLTTEEKLYARIRNEGVLVAKLGKTYRVFEGPDNKINRQQVVKAIRESALEDASGSVSFLNDRVK